MSDTQTQKNEPETTERPGSVLTLASPEEKVPKDFRFWMIFVCLLIATFLAALDLTGAHICSLLAYIVINIGRGGGRVEGEGEAHGLARERGVHSEHHPSYTGARVGWTDLCMERRARPRASRHWRYWTRCMVLPREICTSSLPFLLH